MFRRLALCAGMFVVSHTNADAENWGHWRGPMGNAAAIDANPPTEFSGAEHVKWKVAAPGRGSGSPVVWDDRVFVVSAAATSDRVRGKLAFNTYCFDRQSGNLKWQRTAIEAIPRQDTHATNGYASASPCTDGTHVYSHFGSQGLYCYTMDGEPVWKRSDLLGDATGDFNR